MKIISLARSTSVALAIAIVAGCSGGAVTPKVPSTKQPETARASFTIHWPSRKISNNRAVPQYISPSALSFIVEANPNAGTPGPVTFANANGSSTSTVVIDAPVGTDEFIFTLYDAPQKTGETQAVGNLLGQADVASQKIVAGRVNTVSATIGGVTAHLGIAPISSQPFVESDARGGYDIVGDSPATFAVTPYDADGNVIVAPGAPSLNVSSTVAGTNLNVAPEAGKPNQFTISAIAAKNSTSPLGVTVTATDNGVPHTAQGNLSVRLRSALYVSYAHGGASKIGVFDDQGNVIALPASAFSAAASPNGVAYSAAHHRLFVADSASNSILAFDASGNSVAGFTAPAIAGARGVAYDPQSDLVFATGTARTIAFKPDGSPAPQSATPFAATSTPDAIAYVGMNGLTSTPDDEIAVGNDSTASIDYYSTDGTFIRSDALSSPAVAPISGLAWSAAPIETPILVTGGALGSGYGLAENINGGYALGAPATWASSAIGGVAFASTVPNESAALGRSQYEAYVVQTDANTIAGYIFSADAGTEFDYPDVTIATPASSGLSDPLAIAIAL